MNYYYILLKLYRIKRALNLIFFIIIELKFLYFPLLRDLYSNINIDTFKRRPFFNILYIISLSLLPKDYSDVHDQLPPPLSKNIISLQYAGSLAIVANAHAWLHEGSLQFNSRGQLRRFSRPTKAILQGNQKGPCV
jgi:hypothetical protein